MVKDRSRLLPCRLMVPAVLYWLLFVAMEPEDMGLWGMPLLAMGLCVIASTAALMVAATKRLPLWLLLVAWSPLIHVLVALTDLL